MKLPRWLGGSLTASGGTGHSLDPTVQVLRGAAADAQRSRIPQMAAALSFRTLFGMLPVLAVALWILHRLFKEKLHDLVSQSIVVLGLDRIFVNQAAAAAAVVVESAKDPNAIDFVGPRIPVGSAAGGAAAAQAAQSVAQASQAAEEVVRQSLGNMVEDLVQRLNTIDFTAIGMIGIVTLIYAALSMVVEVERAFNQIYRVPRGRSISRRLVNYWALLTLGPIGLFLTFFIGQRVGAWVEGLTDGSMGIGSGTITLTVFFAVAQVLITGALLVIVYLVVPNTKVKFTSALAGAMLAALAFEAGKYGFAQYVEYSASRSYARLYGSLALIPLFLLWVYVTWMIVLFGLQVAYELQFGRTKTSAQPIFEAGPTIVEPAAGLVVMSAAAKAFVGGQPMTAPMIVKTTGLSDPVVRLVVSRMSERGLLHRVERENGNDEAAYALARAPWTIGVGEILTIGFEISDSNGPRTPGTPLVNPTLERMRRAQIEAAGAETLADAAGLRGNAPAGTRAVTLSDAKPERGKTDVLGGSSLNGVPSPALPKSGQNTGKPATLPEIKKGGA